MIESKTARPSSNANFRALFLSMSKSKQDQIIELLEKFTKSKIKPPIQEIRS